MCKRYHTPHAKFLLCNLTTVLYLSVTVQRVHKLNIVDFWWNLICQSVIFCEYVFISSFVLLFLFSRCLHHFSQSGLTLTSDLAVSPHAPLISASDRSWWIGTSIWLYASSAVGLFLLFYISLVSYLTSQPK